MSSSSSTAHGASPDGRADRCLNCGTQFADRAKFCHACGQTVVNHPPSLLEFVHEFVAHYVALEGPLWRSLKGLALRPGFLTQEYLAGRKTRYILPLRLLLSLGFVFFLTLKLLPANSGVHVTEAVAPTSASDAEFQDAPAWLAPQLKAAALRWEANPQAEYKRVMGKVNALMPYAVLCSLPFFAGILALVFRWRGLSYGAHFVFAMHLHAFFYLGLLLLQIPSAWLNSLVFAWLMIYPLLSIKRVYTQHWAPTLKYGAGVFCLHLTLQLLMLLSVLAFGALGA